jgi:hypothetical protein
MDNKRNANLTLSDSQKHCAASKTANAFAKLLSIRSLWGVWDQNKRNALNGY